MSKYDKYLSGIFSDDNFYKTGNELNQILQRKFQITSSNARKVISRATSKGTIKSSHPITFGNGQYVYFNNKSSLSMNVIKEISKKNRPPVYHLLNLLESNEGIISYYEGLKITASPLRKDKEKSNTLNEILYMLKYLGVIETKKDIGITYIFLSSVKNNVISLMYHHKNNMVMDCFFIPDIRGWLIKHNFIDNKYVVYRNQNSPSKGGEHNNYIWDAFGYTNTTGYNTVLGNSVERDEKKTLVVLDIVIHRSYMSCDVQGFLRRVQAVRSSATKERKILPVAVYQEISAHAYSQLKTLGFIMLNLGTIFGENIYPIIQKIKEIKSSIQFEWGTPEEIVENVDATLFEMEESGQSINLGNMKGDLFEVLMYPLIKLIHPNASIERGKVLKRTENDGTHREYEYDVIVRDFQNEEIIIYEFKGRKSHIEIPLNPYDKPHTVKWFFNTTLPFAREELQKQNSFPVKGCYITTAKFSSDALKVLNEINTHKNVKPETHDVFYDGGKLLKLLEDARETHTINVLKKYYIHEE
ncbi:hypothetical protein [Halobacillus andaensis]|uniref:hypothetical protein n=1 Tax=Halobacillus andaensis TaxID=1176239 RepID=UPI003D73C5F9